MDREVALKDFKKLQDGLCSVNPKGSAGNAFVNYFTFIKRLETEGKKGINFYEMLRQKPELKQKNYIINLLNYYKEKGGNMNETQIWWRIFNVYFGSVSIFKPVVAMDIYCRFKPTSVLDMTMGWGGRLVGACALNVPNYIGIDLNKSLKTPYDNMVKVLKEYSTTKITLMFKSALAVDYSKLNYDMVLTSPPYYNIEVYKGSKRMDKDVWDNEFYKPLIEKSWRYLKPRGHYCLNIPAEVYDRVAKPLLGKPNIFIPMPKSQRTPDEKYKEFIYVWIK